MDELLKKLQACSRFIRLEEVISDLESQTAEEKHRIRELQETISRKEAELQAWNDPGFFQRFLGSGKGKKEKIRQITELNAVWNASMRELENLERKQKNAREEWLALSGSREAYLKARKETQLPPGQESQLMLEELAAFASLALALSRKTQNALETALSLGKDAFAMKETLYQEAAQSARELKKLLDMLPEGFTEISDYLQDPEGWSSEPELALAVSQLQNLTNQLRAILGE